MIKMNFSFAKIPVLVLSSLLFAYDGVNAQEVTYLPPRGKEIYIPKDLQEFDFGKADSKWSYARMAYTNDVAVFWEKPFGDDLNKAPDLDGKNMKVDINNLLFQLQKFYSYYKNDLKFIKPGSNADKYRMMVMLNYSLEGTAYGGDYDGKIGALWIAPNRVQDKKLNCIAHELGHSFQSQIGCDGEGESWGGGGIFEMASQWMLWQVNPQWTTDENYHWKGFIENHNLRFLAMENIYHSPYVLEYWATRRGKTVIGDLFRAGKKGEDPASTYMRMFNLSLDEMNNEMLDCYSRLIAFDFPRVKDTHKKFIGDLVTEMSKTEKGKTTIMKPKDKMIPQTWGFNVVQLSLPEDAKSFKLDFSGLNNDENATYKTRLVFVTENGNASYSDIQSGAQAKYSVNVGEGDYFLVVVGCPKNEYKPFTFNPYEGGGEKEKEVEYPYQVVLKSK